MRKKQNDKIALFTKDLEKFIEEQKTPRERNSDLRRKILALGAHVKKTQLNFKEIKKIKDEKKEMAMKTKESLLQAGVKKSKKRRK